LPQPIWVSIGLGLAALEPWGRCNRLCNGFSAASLGLNNGISSADD
jgi:hypothetical protein